MILAESLRRVGVLTDVSNEERLDGKSAMQFVLEYWSRHAWRLNVPAAVERGPDSWCLLQSTLRAWMMMMIATGKRLRNRIFIRRSLCVAHWFREGSAACLFLAGAPNGGSTTHTSEMMTALVVNELVAGGPRETSRRSSSRGSRVPHLSAIYGPLLSSAAATEAWVESFLPPSTAVLFLSPNAHYLSPQSLMEGLGGSGSKPGAQIAPYIRPQRLRRHLLAALSPPAVGPLPPKTDCLYVQRLDDGCVLVDVVASPLSNQLMMAPDAPLGVFLPDQRRGRREIEN